MGGRAGSPWPSMCRRRQGRRQQEAGDWSVSAAGSALSVLAERVRVAGAVRRSLTGNGLTGSIPSEVGQLSSLQGLCAPPAAPRRPPRLPPRPRASSGMLSGVANGKIWTPLTEPQNRDPTIICFRLISPVHYRKYYIIIFTARSITFYCENHAFLLRES